MARRGRKLDTADRRDANRRRYERKHADETRKLHATRKRVPMYVRTQFREWKV